MPLPLTQSSLRITLLSLWAITGAACAQTTITVDAGKNAHPIDPRIYGVAFATAAQLADLNVPVHRYGGNNTSRYNWKINADNRAFDYYFESIGEDSSAAGGRVDTFISDSKKSGAEAMITIPLLDWVAKLGPNRDKLASFSIKKYGPQTDNDFQWFPDAGNGISAATNNPITGNDPNDANVQVDVAYETDWFKHLVGKWGTADKGGLKYYLMDNESSIWFSTHRDVHPIGPKMEEIRDKILDYSAAIKAVDPSALIVGPEEWGWSGYLFSGYDQQWLQDHNYNGTPDRDQHGGKDYLPWLLDQIHQKRRSPASASWTCSPCITTPRAASSGIPTISHPRCSSGGTARPARFGTRSIQTNPGSTIRSS